MRRLAIPKSLTIKGKRWRVKVTRGLWKRERAIGLCEYEDREILLASTLDTYQRELTLIHEVLHALWPAGIVSSEDEERVIRGLERPLRDVLVSGQLAAVPEET